MLPVLSNRTGDVLIEFHPDAVLEAASTLFTVPPVFAMVIPVCQEKILFVYNNWRKEWEVPAGHIDEGETPHQAALRELDEESGQVIAEATYIGLCLIRTAKQRLEPGVLFTCELATLQPFKANAETSDWMLWDLASPVEGHIDEISLWLVEQFRHA